MPLGGGRGGPLRRVPGRRCRLDPDRAAVLRRARSASRREGTDRRADSASAREAAETAGLFDELATSWLLLDAELLPWNVKAGAAAARTSTPRSARPPWPRSRPRSRSWSRRAARGLPGVGDLLDRTRSRLANAEAFTAAYQRYCWAIDGLAGVRVAPFEVLATEGAVYHERPHLWHLALADRLAAASPELSRTRRVVRGHRRSRRRPPRGGRS